MDVLEFTKLIKQNESEILEFKLNNNDPERIGKYVSALANSSSLLNKQFSYMIWGVTDSKEFIGTTFKPQTQKVGGEPFITWLEKILDPRIIISFNELKIENQRIIVLIIQMTAGRPVSFKGQRYIRSGSSIKNLNGYPEKERELWKSFEARVFEREFAMTNCSIEDIFEYLDVNVYLEMTDQLGNTSHDSILNSLAQDFIIEKSGNSYNITNLGAYTFAKDLINFEKLHRKSIRIVRYKGKNRVTALSDRTANMGVAVGFENLLEFVKTTLPLKEEIYDSGGRRIEQTDYPSLVIREIIANQIVHQDFSVMGSRPMIEIFDNRVEFTNPGAPINEPNRLLDLPPISRNEEMANLFKKIKLVESRGSGIDKIIIALEEDNLPAPDISSRENNTVIILYERKSLDEMNEREKLNAIYYHAVRQFIENEYLTNNSVRERFGLSPNQSSLASKTIALAIESGLIKHYNRNAGNKFMQYIPFWGKSYDEQNVE